MFNFVKKLFNKNDSLKHPTLGGGDRFIYDNGSNSTFSTVYQNYVTTLEEINSAISTISAIASGASMHFYKVDSDGKKRKTVVNQFSTTFINDYQDNHSFIRLAIASILESGAIFIVPEKGKNWRTGFIDFYLLDPVKVKIVTGSNKTIESVIYTQGDGSEKAFKYEDIIYIPFQTSISNAVYPTPKLRSINNIVTLALNSINASNIYSKQGGKKSAIISHSDPLDEQTRKALSQTLKEYYDSPQARALVFNDEHFKVDQISNELDSYKLVQLLNYVNKQILKSFACPAFLLGDVEDIDGDTAKMRLLSSMFFNTTLLPIFKSIQAHITRYIQNTLGLQNVICEFAFDGIHILEQDKIDRAEIINNAFKLGVISINEYRAAIDYEPIEAPAANVNFIAQYLSGSAPISIQHLNEAILARAVSSIGAETNQAPSGEGGAAANAPPNPLSESNNQ